jgi:hypothetical protein
MKNEKIKTITQGRGKFLANGDVFIEETNSSRMLRIGSDGIKWEHVSRIDKKTISMIAWNRYLTKQDVSEVLSILEKTSCSNTEDPEKSSTTLAKRNN